MAGDPLLAMVRRLLNRSGRGNVTLLIRFTVFFVSSIRPFRFATGASVLRPASFACKSGGLPQVLSMDPRCCLEPWQVARISQLVDADRRRSAPMPLLAEISQWAAFHPRVPVV